MRGVAKATIATSVLAATTLLTPGWSDQCGVSLSVESARAVMGRPLTPVSVAGVARRQYRRSVYGAGVAGAAAIGAAAAIGSSSYYGGYYAGAGYYAGSPYYGGYAGNLYYRSGAWDANAYYGGGYAADPYYANAYYGGTYIGGPKSGLWRTRAWYGW